MEWEKEFEKVMGCIPECKNGFYEDVGCPAHGYDAIKAKKFIKQALESQMSDLRKEVQDHFGKDGGPALVIIESHDGGVTQRPALNEVLLLMKK